MFNYIIIKMLANNSTNNNGNSFLLIHQKLLPAMVAPTVSLLAKILQIILSIMYIVKYSEFSFKSLTTFFIFQFFFNQ